MIQFTLKCDRDHRFDSWFQSAEAYEKLSAAGMVTCSICGSTDVDKAMMAPRVQGSRAEVAETPPGPAAPTDQAVADLRRKVEANSEYVGGNFVREARDMHDGLSPHRAVHGEARPDEAKKLIEDGVPVAPLPFIPGRKTN